MPSIQKRLNAFLAEYNLSVQAFERKCNIGVATASKLSENSRATTFAKIAKAYPQLNIDWLKTGEGEMLNPMAHQSAGNVSGHNVCGVNVNGRDIDIKCPTEYETLLEVVNAHNKAVAKMQSQLDKAQSQIDELIAMLKAKL